MAKLIDESNKTYGKWTVVGLAESHKYKNKAKRWRCLCECGTIRDLFGWDLRSRRSTSCGCDRGKKMPYGEAAFNVLVATMKRNAKNRGIVWGLEKEEIRVLTKQNCFYCGVEPLQFKGTIRKQQNGVYLYNGLDRVDNTKGYIIGNVVPCCGDCNWCKRDKAQREFSDWVIRAYNHWACKS